MAKEGQQESKSRVCGARPGHRRQWRQSPIARGILALQALGNVDVQGDSGDGSARPVGCVGQSPNRANEVSSKWGRHLIHKKVAIWQYGHMGDPNIAMSPEWFVYVFQKR